jgi:hypothetical protein
MKGESIMKKGHFHTKEIVLGICAATALASVLLLDEGFGAA